MIILENVYAEITNRWYIDYVVKEEKTLGSVDHWPSVEMCFVAIGTLGRANRISQCKVFRSTTVAAQREGKRGTVAYTETTSCS